MSSYAIKPPLGAKIDKSHPLAPSVCWLLNEGSGGTLIDSASGRQSVKLGVITGPGPAWGSSKQGSFLTFNGNNYAALNGQSIIAKRNSSFSLVIWYATTSSANPSDFYRESNATASNQLFFVRSTPPTPGVGKITVLLRDDSGVNLTPSNTPTVLVLDGLWHQLVCVFDYTALRLNYYNDGQYLSYDTISTTSNTLTLNAAGLAGSLRNSGYAATGVGSLTSAMGFPFALNAQQVASLYAQPYQMFQVPLDRYYSIPSSSRIYMPYGWSGGFNDLTGGYA